MVSDQNSEPGKTQRDEDIYASQTRRDPPDAGADIRVVVPEDLKRRYRIDQHLPTQGAEADILLAYDPPSFRS